MWVILTVLQTLNSLEPFREDQLDEYDGEVILEAVRIARRYELPIVIRLLCESLQKPTPHNQRLLYAIYVLAGLPDKAAAMAKIITGHDITQFEPDVAQMLRDHAPGDWMRLQDLTLRRIFKLPEFYESLKRGEFVQSYYNHMDDECSDPIIDPDIRIVDALKRAKTVEEIKELRANFYGLTCGWCQDGAKEFYNHRVEELLKVAEQY